MSVLRQRGFSLIEVLVSLIVICIGVLGMVALQSRSLVQTQDSVLRNNAIMLAGDLIEMMRSNPGGGPCRRFVQRHQQVPQGYR
ncbi:type IV pilus modification protein PilV [Pseudomonas sp. Snoq117.2]|uniref:type IV pilus modification protein PilV n=1 Tax=Pseudomonas sp. Snoq117.2 TaxID=1500302 RepID=UPI0008CCF54F|nr:type IV pilus modification protein PilV [Pseudomonas sp. Snoq117.2]SEP42964.1 type IV pilus modification protein PilV [Pseudomonas sp. Snoq117.2]